VRFLNGWSGTAMVDVAALVTSAIFSVHDPAKAGSVGIIQAFAPTANGSQHVPADARYLQLVLSSKGALTETPFIEWVMAPATL
jgi:hypothetical protein